MGRRIVIWLADPKKNFGGRGGIAPPAAVLSAVRLRGFIKVSDATRPTCGSNQESFCRFATGSADADGEGFVGHLPLEPDKIKTGFLPYSSKLALTDI